MNGGGGPIGEGGREGKVRVGSPRRVAAQPDLSRIPSQITASVEAATTGLMIAGQKRLRPERAIERS